MSCPHLGAWATGWLGWAAGAFLEHPASRPIRPFDRLALDEVVNGIAAIVVAPHGEIDGRTPRDPKVRLWKLLPIRPDELKSFRDRPGTQIEWVIERSERREIGEIERRWTAVAP